MSGASSATRRAVEPRMDRAARRRRGDLRLHAGADPDHGRGVLQRVEPLALPAARIFAALVGRARFRWEWIDPLLFSLKLGLAAGACSHLARIAAGLRAGAARLSRSHGAARIDARAAAAAGARDRRRPAAVVSICRPARLHRVAGACCADMWSSACRSRCAPPRSACRACRRTWNTPPRASGRRPGAYSAHVILPLIKNGIVAGAVFAFIHSFTDVNLSLFLARPGRNPDQREDPRISRIRLRADARGGVGADDRHTAGAGGRAAARHRSRRFPLCGAPP